MIFEALFYSGRSDFSFMNLQMLLSYWSEDCVMAIIELEYGLFMRLSSYKFLLIRKNKGFILWDKAFICRR